MNGKHKRPRRKEEKTRKVTRISHAKVKRMIDRRIGNQAAYEQQISYELCDDLAGQLTRRSGRGRTNYSLIAKAFVCVRSMSNGKKNCSLVTLLRDMYANETSLRDFLKRWDKHIYEYILAHINSHDHPLQTRGCVIGDDLMRPLAAEYVRDRKMLMAFLSAAFQRWREIYAPNSLWRVRLVTQQIAPLFGHDRKRILNHLQKIGAIPSNLTPAHLRSWLSRIGQYLSRDQRNAAGKDFGFRRRPKPSSFGGFLKRKLKKK